jgi:deferrochelatase/peroxidase EfeB
MPTNRRGFLAGIATGTVSLGVAACSQRIPPASVDRPTTPAAKDPSTVGAHQPGVTSMPPAAAALLSLDLTISSRDQLLSLFQLLTSNLRLLERRSFPDGGVTVTLAVGDGLFDKRFGLSKLRPSRLTAMPRFPNDAPEASWSHGDLLLQMCAQQLDSARAGLRQLLHDTDALVRPGWSINGFRPENQISGQVPTTRNLFGFREGIGNPNPGNQALMDQLVWVQADGPEPAWTAGGTYQVVRLIRFATELWDAEPVEHQEDVFGRHKQTGAPLAGKREDQAPNFAVDPDGRITPLDAHIRRANPRTPGTEANRILRRSYSYRRGRDAAGRPDEGLIFICFQQDLERGFATVQRRLRGEALEKYVLPFGGGYFFVLPAASPGGYLGQQLLEAAASR